MCVSLHSHSLSLILFLVDSILTYFHRDVRFERSLNDRRIFEMGKEWSGDEMNFFRNRDGSLRLLLLFSVLALEGREVDRRFVVSSICDAGG